MTNNKDSRRHEGEGFDSGTGNDIDFHNEIFDEEFEQRVNPAHSEIIRRHRAEEASKGQRNKECGETGWALSKYVSEDWQQRGSMSFAQPLTDIHQWERRVAKGNWKTGVFCEDTRSVVA